ncbi:MAG: SipW-dependent-type signal peptide-containing protein [Acutalibacteraceae bacterium]
MKKQIMVGTALAVTAMVATGSTLAYFTAEDTALNKISTGSVDIDIVETMQTDCGIQPYEDPTEPILAGDTVSKIVQVKNTGTGDTYIRAKITVDFEDNTELSTDMITLNLNTDKWELAEDGYYYYKDIVPAGETTEALFDSFVLSTDAGNEYQSQALNIQIDAEAIQSRNNSRTNPFVAE